MPRKTFKLPKLKCITNGGIPTKTLAVIVADSGVGKSKLNIINKEKQANE